MSKLLFTNRKHQPVEGKVHLWNTLVSEGHNENF